MALNDLRLHNETSIPYAVEDDWPEAGSPGDHRRIADFVVKGPLRMSRRSRHNTETAERTTVDRTRGPVFIL